MKVKKFSAGYIQRAYPGHIGWEHLPPGCGDHYAVITAVAVHPDRHTWGHGRAPLHGSVVQAIQDLRLQAESEEIKLLAIQLPGGHWRLIKL
jgi:hypothetical protein